MNKSRHLSLSLAWLALALALWPALRAQETPPAPPAPATAPAETTKSASADQPAPTEQPAAPDKPVSADKPDATDQPAAPAAAEEPTVAPAEKPASGELRELGAEGEKPAPTSNKKNRGRPSGKHGQPPKLGDQTVSSGKTQNEAVSFAGDTVVDGHVTDSAVSIFGNTTVNGSADDAAVSVFGTTTVNGHVKGEAVAIFGDVVLGPNAVVDGEAVAILGKVVRGPGSQVHGGIQQIGGHRNGAPPDFSGLRAYLEECVFMVRPLAFDSRVLWAWGIAFGFLAFYAFLALVAPKGVDKCVETFEQSPGYSLLTAVLTLVLTPIAVLLLILTMVIGIGFVLVPVFGLGLFIASLFGKVVLLAWLGRRFTNLVGGGALAHPFFGVVVGGIVMLGLYTIPFAGFIFYKLIGFLGMGVVVFTLVRTIAANRPPKPAPVSPAFVATPLAPGEVPPVVPANLPPVISAVTLPRVGFWLRIAASLLDAVLVGMVCGFMSNLWHGFGVFPLWYAVYCVSMWATKGTTVGGIICSLKVVRIDDRPLDWGVAIVRGLGGFLSLFVAGLGFIWVAFDDDKQSWHDKIAGTTIVRVPRGTALL